MSKQLHKTKTVLNDKDLKKRLLDWYNTSDERREARSLKKKNETIKVKEARDKNKFPSTKTGLKKLKEKIRKDNLRKRLEKANSYNEDSLDAEELKRVNLERNLKYFTFNLKEMN